MQSWPHGMSPIARVSLPVALLAFSACAGPVRPAVLPNMENLPTDPDRRAQQLESQTVTASPESRRSLSPRARTAETAAATVAAVVGSLLSSRVPGDGAVPFFFGAAAPAEEMRLVDPTFEARKKAAARQKDANGAETGVGPDGKAKPLVPWIEIRPEEAGSPPAR